MMLLLFFLSCSNDNKKREHIEEIESGTGFHLCPPPLTIYGEPVHIRFNSGKDQDSLSVDKELSDRVRRNMMHWCEYSMMESDR